MVICLDSGARCRLAHGPADATATVSFSKIQIAFTFLVPVRPGIPEKGPLKCVCVCVFVVFFVNLLKCLSSRKLIIECDYALVCRQFLWSFRLPGEAQKIDRMMECFAQRYCELNPGVFTSTGRFYVGVKHLTIIVMLSQYPRSTPKPIFL